MYYHEPSTGKNREFDRFPDTSSGDDEFSIIPNRQGKLGEAAIQATLNDILNSLPDGSEDSPSDPSSEE